MMVAIPELDGAIGPMIFGGRSDARRRAGGPSRHGCRIAERAGMLAARVAKLVALRRAARGERQASRSCCSTSRRTPATPARRPICRSSHRCTTRCSAHAGRRLPRRGARPASTRCASASSTAMPHASAPTPMSQRRIPADDHVRRERWLAEIEAQWGPAPGRQQTDGGSTLRARRAVRQRLRRRAAGLRLRGRSDAAAVREGLRADPRLLRLLPLPARGFRRPRGAALRHPRRARVHARQAGRHVGRPAGRTG